MSTRCGYWLALMLWSVSALAIAASPNLDDYDQVILDAEINLLKKGSVFCLLSPDEGSDIWVKAEDFPRLGLALSELAQATRDGVSYYRLSGSSRLKLTLDLQALVLSIDAAPELLGKQVINLNQGLAIPPSQAERELHGYLNYSVATQQMSQADAGYSASLQLNLAARQWRLRTQHELVSQAGESQQLRLETSLSHDFPNQAIRLTLGDTQASSGQFGQTRQVAGINFARQFGLNPAINPAPGLSFTGAASTNTRAELYVDGARLKSLTLAPGQYELNDLYYFSGLRNVDLVLTNQTGQRQTIPLQHYFTTSQLRPGLSEFSLTLGAPRQSISQGGGYQDWIASGLYRRGLTNQLTLGVRGEAMDAYQSYGLTANQTLARFGLLDSAVSFSHHRDGQLSGHAFSLNYQFSRQSTSYSASYLNRSEGFGVIPQANNSFRLGSTPKHQFSASAGLSFAHHQTLSLNLSQAILQDQGSASLQSVRYTWQPRQGLNFNASLTHLIDSQNHGFAGWIGVSWNLDRQQTLSAQIERYAKGQTSEAARYSHAIPSFTGGGGNLGLYHSPQSQTAEAYGQYNTASAAYSVSARLQQSALTGSQWSSEARITGAIAYLQGHVFTSRSISSSYGVVDLDGLPRVRVYQNNQYVGNTDSRGLLLLPNLMSYSRNQISIDDRDIPLERTITTVRKDIVPRADMGVGIHFSAQTLRAIGAILQLPDQSPLKSVAFTLSGADSSVNSFTGPDGDFYLENLSPGQYQLQTTSGSVSCQASVNISANMPVFTQLGAIFCRETNHAP